MDSPMYRQLICATNLLWTVPYIGTVFVPLITALAKNGTVTERLTYDYILSKQGYLYSPSGRAYLRHKRG